ncbi:hypothetical protein W04_3291 [Pseudoalteromonas sp. SW0106-04]|nr:hypothetical protein W04_3291 [Pseudoalteromonas sp. SW0106-04]
MADAVSDEKYKKQAKSIIAERQLVGAANNTKWNELISEVREFSESHVIEQRWLTVTFLIGIANGTITCHFHC